MEELLKSMNERLKYLEEQEQTVEIIWRTNEINLSIVAVQQRLLSGLVKCKCKDRSSTYYDKEDNEICYDCDNSIN